MNIWIDLGHIPQFNFYKFFICKLSELGHNVYVTVLQRGKLTTIVDHEVGNLPNVIVLPFGKHKMTKFSVIVDVNLVRIPKLLRWSAYKHIDMAFSNGHHSGIVSRFLKIPSYAFGDDPQTKSYKIFVKYATKSHMLIYEETEQCKILPKDNLVKCLKEWAYLSPKYFKSNIDVLQKYGVKPKEYVFLREVSVGTMNYAAQKSGAVLGIKDLIPKNKKVLLSLEEKHRRNEYPEDWILLQEPIDDIHSLIYYSAGLVSSGDSMAREAALLGVPSYYLGVRHSMPANAAAHKVAGLQNELSMPFEQWVKTLDVDANEAAIKQEKLRKHIDEEFIDINEYMLSLVDEVAKKKQKK